MGSAAAIRSFDATIRRHDRELERLKRKSARERHVDSRRDAKQAELKLAEQEVADFESRIDQLTQIGRDCGERINWHEESRRPEPASPEHSEDLDKYSLDRQEYRAVWQNWEQQTHLARQVLAGDLHVYAEVLQEVSPFEALHEVGSEFSFAFESPLTCCVDVDVLDQTIVPTEIKALTPTGKLTSRAMPVTRKFEIYQDYVCGAIFRAARESFSLLPLRFVISSAYCELLNLSNGLHERVCIASVGARRETTDDVDFDHVDFSEAMTRFPHRMEFNKRSGFRPVKAFILEDFDLSDLMPINEPM